ncbi:P-loop containing nucleoside triphosphatehydrolases superfamily protein [Striga asiatica]|uniref:P-loop containing nucleoside triphosphatehydrolases superfamily protein n=1 Tax=Striga asiatica TaxID=4170 RepID=A0A5A7NY20_STRAF|nr:P-loop containing nucleoside triphosphatehydrolases superfamily protein [Striga asiatica]
MKVVGQVGFNPHLKPEQLKCQKIQDTAVKDVVGEELDNDGSSAKDVEYDDTVAKEDDEHMLRVILYEDVSDYLFSLNSDEARLILLVFFIILGVLLCGVYAQREAFFRNIDHPSKVFDMALSSIDGLPQCADYVVYCRDEAAE